MEVVEAFTNIGAADDEKAMLILEQDGRAEVVERDLEQMAEICRLSFKPPRLKLPVHKKKGNRCWKHAGQPCLVDLHHHFGGCHGSARFDSEMVRKITEISKKYNIRIMCCACRRR